MACSHAAHDCRIGNSVILANGVMLAGHVQVGDYTFFGGGAGIHQFCRIGQSVMLGGHGSISADVPPFLIVTERNDAFGLNLVGLRRRGSSEGDADSSDGGPHASATKRPWKEAQAA